MILESFIKMKKPPFPFNEEQRLKDLYSLGAIYTPAEHRFDRITDLACQLFKVPMCLISLVAGNCQWFKSVQGLTVEKTSREVSFCAHAILQTGPFVIEDTLKNSDFADNPLVSGPPFIRFYAGCQLVHGASNIGTICIIDTEPRSFTLAEKETLESLAKWVESELKTPVFEQEQIDMLLRFNDDERQSMLDGVTGCWKDSYAWVALEPEIERAKNKDYSINLLTLKLDNYGNILSEYGQNPTNFMMKFIAHRLRALLRTTDFVFRAGQDGFIAYIPNCPEDMVADISKHLLQLLENEPFTMAGRAFRTPITTQIHRFENIQGFQKSDIYQEHFCQCSNTAKTSIN